MHLTVPKCDKKVGLGVGPGNAFVFYISQPETSNRGPFPSPSPSPHPHRKKKKESGYLPDPERENKCVGSFMIDIFNCNKFQERSCDMMYSCQHEVIRNSTRSTFLVSKLQAKMK